MMDLITITISPDGRTAKPDGAEERSILSKMKPIEIRPQEFIEIVGRLGHSFYPATFELEHVDGHINSNSFRTSQVLVADIDNTKDGYQFLSAHQALERCREHGLECNGIYVTFSDDTDPNLSEDEKLLKVTRYRMIFVLDRCIHGADNYNFLLREVLYQLFPEADQMDASSIYFGGKDVIYRNPDYRLNPLHLVNAAHAFQTNNISTTQAKSRRFKKLITELPPQLLNQRVILGESSKATHCNNIYIQSDANEPLRRFDWAAARKKCKLLDDFLGCKRKIWHNELYGLYTAMKRIRGGKTKWKDAVKDNQLIDNVKIVEVAKWIDDFESKGGYIWETKLSKYAADDPAAKKHKRLTDINQKRNQEAKLLENHNHYFIPLKEAELGLDYFFNHFLSKWDSKISLIKGATGLGKTLLYTQCRHLDECIIAVPNHKLKNEVSERLTNEGVEHNVIPELPDLPDSILNEYNGYQNIGRHDLAARFLRSLIKGDLSKFGLRLSEPSMLRFKLIGYFSAIDRAVNDTIPILCTHKRVLHTEFANHSTLIIDEDIMETAVEVKSVSLGSIRKSLRKLKNQTVKNILQKFVDLSNDHQQVGKVMPISEVHCVPDTSDFVISKDEIRSLIKAGVKDEIISLFRAKYFVIKSKDWNDPDADKVIHFILKNELPDMKTIVLSATASEFMYEKLLGDMDVYDLSNVVMEGCGIQYSNRSFSRRSFDDEKTINKVKKVANAAGNCPVITYKGNKYQQHFKNTFRHIENIEGTDELIGQSIFVHATPNKPYYVYQLWASLLGIDYSHEDEYKQREVEHNGFEFNITTFGNKNLQKIQFHFIESRLVQAVGRSRLVREPAHVYVFSKYPLIGFEQKHLNKLVTPNAIAEVFDLQTGISSGSLAS